MTRSILLCGLALSVLFTTAAEANNDPIVRAAGFVHKCKRGESAGAVCDPTDPNGCVAPGVCVPVIAKKAKAIMTVIVDDDVRGLEPSETLKSGGTPQPVSAMTALLEVKGKMLFAQTFQDFCPRDGNNNQACGSDPTLPQLILALKSGPVIVHGDQFNEDKRITEATVGGIFGTTQAGAENLLQFRTGFGFNEALRAHFEITGPEVPVITTVQKVDFMDRHTDGLPNGQNGDGVATVLRFLLGIVFLTPVGP